jgi:hypothetical protein
MPADYTDTVETVGKVLGAAALTSAEKSYAFTKNATPRTLQGICPQAWYYAYTTSGPYFPVPANVPFNMKILQNPQTLYFKRQSVDGTLSIVVSE